MSLRPRRPRRLVLVVCLVLAGLGLALAVPGPAAGQQDTQQQQVAAVQKQAYFTRPATTTAPPILLDGFPPGTACLVAGLVGFPQACGEEVTDLTDQLGLGDGPPVPVSPDSQVAQPVAPDTLPVGMAGGQERYASLLQFDLPQPPAGQEFGTVELLLRPSGVSYAAESPAFREMVLAAMSQVSDQDPNQFVEVLADAAAGETALVAEAITGIEACPTTEPWEEGEAQDAGEEGERFPEVDCLVGTTGEFDESSNTWVFDITFAVQAWQDGGTSGDALMNEGIALRPLGADNLAYGDPDLSTNWLVSLADDTAEPDLRPRLRYSLTPAVEESGPPSSAVASPAPLEPSSPATSPPSGGGASQVVETPSEPAQALVPGNLRARYAEPAATSGAASNPWWLLLLVPLLLSGAWSLGESVLARPAHAPHRGGALDRLMRSTAPTRGDLP